MSFRELWSIGPFRLLVLVVLVLLCLAAVNDARAQTAPQFLTISVSEAVSPVSTVLTWACPAGSVTATATSSNPSSIWNGAKPLSGSQSLSGIKADTSYKLDCATAAGSTVSARLSWDMPTTYTDGTPLNPPKDLKGYRVFVGPDPATIGANPIDVNDPVVTDYQITGLKPLAPGAAYAFGVKAVSVQGIESDLSNIVLKVLPLAPATVYTNTVSVRAIKKPGPPVLKNVDQLAEAGLRQNLRDTLYADTTVEVVHGNRLYFKRYE